MAQFFKRRAKPGPSKNEQKVERSREAARTASRAGVLGQRFPSVERLSVELAFSTPEGHALDNQKRAYRATDPCDFSVPCLGRCGGGTFDLAAKIEAVVTARERLSESNGTCQQSLYAGSPDVCGCRLSCRIEVSYLPQAASA